jgi:hypothetical protein
MADPKVAALQFAPNTPLSNRDLTPRQLAAMSPEVRARYLKQLKSRRGERGQLPASVLADHDSEPGEE